MGLRSAAAAVYDMSVRRGRKPEAIQKEILPITTKLHQIITTAVKTDLAGIVVAIQRFESHALSYDDDIIFLTNKAQDARNHANMLRKAVLDHMIAHNVMELHHGEFMATRTIVDGKDAVTLR